ncbi:MAG: ArnT family glycosyltransferase [Candidatus Binatia bacterium]
MNLTKEHQLAIFLFLGFICYLTFFRGLGDYGLWDPDEGRSGVIAKEIVASGNWLTLSHSGEPYYDKPQLYFWLVALGIKLLGLNELAVRLPSALAASLTVGVVYLWGCFSGGWKWGLWGGLVLASSMEFIALGRFGNMDMVFTFFFTAALLSFLRWKQQGKGWIWLFYLFLALASITKGPVGALLPLLIVGITVSLQKKWALLREMRLLPGLGMVVLIFGSWCLLTALRDPEYVKTFLWNHNILRFFILQRGIGHPEPIYHFFPVLMVGFLPWSFFLPPVLHNLWERRVEEGQEEKLFLVVWLTTVLIFFSLARNKLGTYVLPAFPPLALLTGGVIRQCMEGGEARPWRRRWILYGSFCWLFFIVSLSPLSEMVLRDRYPQYLPLNPHLFLSALFILLAVLGWVLRKESWIPGIVSLSSLWLVLWFYGVKAPDISELRGTRTLARMVNGNAAPEYRVVAIRAESFSFYLSNHVQVVSQSAMIENMLEEPIPTVALVKEKHLTEMRHIHPSRLFVWKAVSSARALVANFPLIPAQDLGRVPKD